MKLGLALDDAKPKDLARMFPHLRLSLHNGGLMEYNRDDRLFVLLWECQDIVEKRYIDRGKKAK